MKNIFLSLILFVCVCAKAQNTNIATLSGNWDVCSTWNNPIKNYNTIYDYKIVNNNVVVTQNRPVVHTKKINLLGNGKVILSGTNKISFVGESTVNLPNCNSNYIDKVIVNFNEPVVDAKSLSGFLQGLRGICSDPSTELIENPNILPLQPKLFRQWQMDKYQKSYDLTKTTSTQGRVHMLLSDYWTWWNVPSVNHPRTESPFEDEYELYKEYLNVWFDWGNEPDTNNVSPKPGIVWECWNEPDNAEFWPWSQAQFFNTYKIFYQTLKDSNIGATAKVAGPSITKYDEEYLTAFFDSCLTNGLEVNVVTWHELDYDYNDSSIIPTRPISTIKEHVESFRDNFLNNPKYARLNFETIEINEIVTNGYKDNPAATASYLGHLEQSKVDYAVKACWEDGSFWPNNDDCDACNSNTLNHLFTLNDEKKSNWWVYKYYGDGVTNRVKSYNENGRSVVISSKNVAYPEAPVIPYAQVLFGFSDDSSNATVTSGIYNFRLKNISSIIPNSTISTKCYIKIKKIPNQSTELLSPIVVFNGFRNKDVSDSIILDFEVEKECLYQLTISASPLP